MLSRCKVIDTINLKGYRLVYKGLEDNYVYLTIEKCEKSYVPLALFSISLFDTIALDNYEGYPFSYSKKYFTVDVEGKEKDAFLYVMNNDNDYHIPSDKYVEICKKGYKDFNFDEAILDKAYNDTCKNIKKLELKR